MQSRALNDPNSQVFTHSTMITYDGRNGGQPRIVEKSIRKAGDVKETRLMKYLSRTFFSFAFLLIFSD